MVVGTIQKIIQLFHKVKELAVVLFDCDTGAKLLHFGSIMWCHGIDKLPECLWKVITIDSVKMG